MRIKNKISASFFAAIAILFLISGSNSLLAQNATSSPYSRFGIGDLNSITFAPNLALGGTEIGISQPGHINFGNPAGYSALYFTTYEGGLDFKQNEFKTSYSKHRANTASVSYFDFAFPIKQQKWALGFGLSPYSKVGYLVSSTSTNSFGDKEISQYEGSGGLNNFHIGTGFKVTKKLSLGLNSQYLFGVINNVRTVAYNSPYYFNTSIKSATSVGWFHFNAGLQYRMDSLAIAKSDSITMFEKRIAILQESLNLLIHKSTPDTTQETYAKKNQLAQEIAQATLMKENVLVKKKKTDWHLVLGLVASPQIDLHASNSQLINSFRYKFYGTPELLVVVRDTVFEKNEGKSYIRLPFSAGFGFSLLKGSRWLFCSDFNVQQWSKFSFLGAEDSLVDSWKVSAGIQFTPNERAFGSYLKTIQYRLGARYDNGYLKFNGTNISEICISTGFGLPVRKAGTLLHFTCEFGRRGTTKNDLILERYVKFTVGFTINDRWFVKSKYD